MSQIPGPLTDPLEQHDRTVREFTSHLPNIPQPFVAEKVWIGSSEVKDTNPKAAIGGTKIPLHLWPNTASVMGALAFLDGAGKYGRQNYRPMGAKASTYYDAAKRHLDAWFEGEDLAPDSMVHHLGHALACLAILVETIALGNLEDDRNYPGGYFKLIENLEGEVTRIKDKYAGRTVVHYDLRVFKKALEKAPTDLPV